MISTTLLELSVPNPVTDNGLSKQLVQHILHLRAEVYTQSTPLLDVVLTFDSARWFCVIVHIATTHSRGHGCRSADHAETSSQFVWLVFEILQWSCFDRIIFQKSDHDMTWRDFALSGCLCVPHRGCTPGQPRFSANSGINVLQ